MPYARRALTRSSIASCVPMAPSGWSSNGARSITDSDGHPTRILGTCQDITERKSTERALRASDERLALATKSAGLGSWDSDLTTGQITWSPRQQELFGFAPGEFGGTIESLFDRVHPEDRDGLEQAIARARDSGELYEHEYRVVLPGGTVRWIAGFGRNHYDASGRAVRVVGVCQDITERKQAEVASATICQPAGASPRDRSGDPVIALASGDRRGRPRTSRADRALLDGGSRQLRSRSGYDRGHRQCGSPPGMVSSRYALPRPLEGSARDRRSPPGSCLECGRCPRHGLREPLDGVAQGRGNALFHPGPLAGRGPAHREDLPGLGPSSSVLDRSGRGGARGGRSTGHRDPPGPLAG